jgi:LysM repeat protein
MRKVLLMVPFFVTFTILVSTGFGAHTNAEQLFELSPNIIPSFQLPTEQIVKQPTTEVAVTHEVVSTPVQSVYVPTIIEVVSGDTLSSIADSHQTTYQRLFDANPDIANPDNINPGQQIRLPLPDEALESRHIPVAVKTVQISYAVRTTVPIASTAPTVADGSVWDKLAACESGGNWSINTGNGFYGGLQFTLATWHAVGGSGYPNENSREEQIARAEILLSRSNWGQWPACTSKLGLR